MKSTTMTQKGAGVKKPATGNTRPEIRDNLDSRKNEEFDYQGDNVTHTHKAHRDKPASKNK